MVGAERLIGGGQLARGMRLHGCGDDLGNAHSFGLRRLDDHRAVPPLGQRPDASLGELRAPRQKEVAAVWCRLVTTEILTLQHLVYAMLYGPRSDRARALIKKHIKPIVDEALEGYETITASSAAAALGRLDRETVDGILSDVVMPEMDGLAFLEALRERAT